jgi:uncharacterized membrane protein YgdD (TMEM256/DUF423 family)
MSEKSDPNPVLRRPWLLLAAASGFLAVAFGAFGLRSTLAVAADGAERLGWWKTAAEYHLAHALALGLVALFLERGPRRAFSVAGGAFAAGTLLFSGSLYAMAFTGVRWLGAVTPFGGMALLGGWAALDWGAVAGGGKGKGVPAG